MMRAAALSAALASLSLSPAALAEPRLVHDVSAGVLGQSSSWFAGTAWRHQLELASRLSPSAFPLSFVTGIRLAATSAVPVPGEVFVRLELTGRMGKYLEPACGPELGLSGLTRPDAPPRGAPAGARGLEIDRAGAAYLTIVASPLRLHWGSFRVVLADFHLGSSLAGSVAQFAIGYARVEYRP